MYHLLQVNVILTVRQQSPTMGHDARLTPSRIRQALYANGRPVRRGSTCAYWGYGLCVVFTRGVSTCVSV